MIIIVSNITITMLVIHLIFYLASAYYIYKTAGKSPAQSTLIKMTAGVLCSITYWYIIARPFVLPQIRIILPTFMCASMVLSYNAHISLFDNYHRPIYREPLAIQTLVITIICLIIGLFKSPPSLIIDVKGPLTDFDLKNTQSISYYTQNTIYTLWLLYLSFQLIEMFYYRAMNIAERTIQLRLIAAMMAWFISAASLLVIMIDIVIAIIVGGIYHDTINIITLILISLTSVAFMINVVPQPLLEIIVSPINSIMEQRRKVQEMQLNHLSDIMVRIVPQIRRVSSNNKTTPMIEINDARDIIWSYIPRVDEMVLPDTEVTFIIDCLKSNTILQGHGPHLPLHPKQGTKQHALQLYKLISRHSIETSPAASLES